MDIEIERDGWMDRKKDKLEGEKEKGRKERKG